MKYEKYNQTAGNILFHVLTAAFSLFVNGFGIYLTIRASIGAAPWDVFNLGVANTFRILYGNASVAIAFLILLIDVLMREPIGIAMFIDAVVVGKSVDLFNRLDLVKTPDTVLGGVLLLTAGMFVVGFTQYFYMRSSLGCGPRDTLMVGINRRMPKVPVGIVSSLLQGTVTLIGWLLGGPVGLGTVLYAVIQGPIMQLAFILFKGRATDMKHQNIITTFKILFRKKAA